MQTLCRRHVKLTAPGASKPYTTLHWPHARKPNKKIRYTYFNHPYFHNANKWAKGAKRLLIQRAHLVYIFRMNNNTYLPKCRSASEKRFVVKFNIRKHSRIWWTRWKNRDGIKIVHRSDAADLFVWSDAVIGIWSGWDARSML